MARPIPWRRLWPDRIASQIAALVLLSVLAIHAAFFLSFLLLAPALRGEAPQEMTGRIAALARLVAATSPGDRPALIETARLTFPDLDIGLAAAMEASPPATRERPPDFRQDHLRRLVGPGLTVTATAAGAATRFAIGLPDGAVLTVDAPRDRGGGGGPPGPLRATLVFVMVSLALLGAWTVVALMRPLRAIADAVEAYGSARSSPPLPERGPREIRALARALNAMRTRIGRLIDERTRALAAVSHDLRTPITRLRLRAEFLDNAAERARMVADLDQMDALVQSALAHLRDGRGDEEAAPVDLPSLLQTVSDRFADMGHDIPVAGPDRLAVRARPLELERAIVNLADNARKYGRDPRITLSRQGGSAVIEVSDEGPGIAPERREEMFRPFTRGEAARTMDDQDGFGLGLTIARSIVEAHGGTLELIGREPAGLTARVTLPLA